MKTDKNRPVGQNIALTPRQAALRKLLRLIAFVGTVAAVVVGSVLLAFYGHLLRPRGKLDWFGSPELREPRFNSETPPGDGPEGMVWIRGGEFYMGDEGMLEAMPMHLVYVDGFWMDKHEVTNEQFAKFVAATGFVTEAEKQPDPRDFPDAPKEKLKPFSGLFKKPGPNDFYNLETHEGWWDIMYGASWKHPEGPGSTIKGREKHPVVHICYADAVAYCEWAKKRLPTEAEWEFAARGGLDRKMYSWGDELTPGGKWMANIWQGNFPRHNSLADGFEGAAPVGSFPPNGYGLHDMAGNVWEWCADWYQPSYYRDSPKDNPQGPDSGWDPLEPRSEKRVQRGGSFLCAENYCVRYVVGSRGKGEAKSALNHTGFRCVRDPDTKIERTLDTPWNFVPWLLGSAVGISLAALALVWWWLSRKNGVAPA